MPQMIYLCWDVENADPYQNYVGGGYYDTKFKNQRIETKRALWSEYSEPAMLEAQKYLDENMMDGRLNPRIETGV